MPNICGSHSPICSGVPLAASEAAANPVPRIDNAIPGVTPEHLLEDGEHAEPGRFGGLRGEQLHGVKADLGRLLDERPRRFLALIPLRGRGPHDVGGELVHPVPDLDHVLRQFKRKRHCHSSFPHPLSERITSTR